LEAAMTATDQFDPNKVGDEIKEHVAQIETAEGSLIEHKRAAAALLQDVAKNHGEHLNAVCVRAGLGKSRKSELLQIALGRKSEAQVKNETKKRVAKHRAAKRLAEPKSGPNRSVTRPVTEEDAPATQPDAEASAEARKAEYAATEAPEQAQDAQTNPEPSGDARETSEKKRNTRGERALAEFRYACDHYLAQMNAGLRFTAIEYARALKEDLDAKDAAKQEAKNEA
jgi:hypothetical protein